MSKVQFNSIIRSKISEIPFDDYINILRLETSIFKQSLESTYDSDSDIELMYLKDNDNQIIGYLTFKDLDISYDIYMFAVAPHYQKMGIATKLINPLLDKDIILEVRESNIPAIKFYEKNNFKAIRRKTKYYQTEDAIVYYREV